MATSSAKKSKVRKVFEEVVKTHVI